MTVLDAIHDRKLFGPWFSTESWRAWLVFLAALFGLPLEGEDAALFTTHTGRQQPSTAPAREAWVIVGRRGGKSRIAALIAVYLACFRSYDGVLAPGEVGTLPVIAADRRQARTILRYINGFFDSVPMLGAMVVHRTKDSIELNNRIVIEVHTASWRTLRGYTVVSAICDEVAVWRSDEGGANPDNEILGALRPGMASVPGALLIAISSPYARKGALFEAWSKHFAKDDDPILVWQGDTISMNPSVDRQIIADAYADDPSSAAAEYGALFRSDVESFISREAVMACVVPDRGELPPQRAVQYVAFVDPAGGAGADSYTLAIAHAEPGGRIVLDAIRERRPPFSPEAVSAEFAALLKEYRIAQVEGDRFAGDWPRERLRVHRINYKTADRTASDIYAQALPLLTAQRLELLDHPRLIAQLLQLERRTGQAGRDRISHAPRGHDDIINAALGAALLADRARRTHIGWLRTAV